MKTYRRHDRTKSDEPTDDRIACVQLRVARFEASNDIARVNDTAIEPRLLDKLASGWPFKRDWHPLVVLLALYLIAMSVDVPFDL